MDLATLQAFEAEVERQVPGFRLAYKDESWSQKLLGKLMSPFNSGYLTSFTTTLGKTVYFPSREFYTRTPYHSFSILAHELVHLRDDQKHGLWFGVSYLMPQILFVPFLLAALLGLIWSAWSLLLLVPALACLAPWPAPWRAHWEGRGYAMTMAVTFWAWGSIMSNQKESIAKNFYGPNYFHMVWGKDKAMKLLEEKETLIVNGTLAQEEPYASVLAFMQNHGIRGGS